VTQVLQVEGQCWPGHIQIRSNLARHHPVMSGANKQPKHGQSSFLGQTLQGVYRVISFHISKYIKL